MFMWDLQVHLYDYAKSRMVSYLKLHILQFLLIYRQLHNYYNLIQEKGFLNSFSVHLLFVWISTMNSSSLFEIIHPIFLERFTFFEKQSYLWFHFILTFLKFHKHLAYNQTSLTNHIPSKSQLHFNSY